MQNTGSKMSGSTDTMRRRSSPSRTRPSSSNSLSSGRGLISMVGFHACYLLTMVVMVNSFTSISTQTSKAISFGAQHELTETKSLLAKSKMPRTTSNRRPESLRFHQSKSDNDGESSKKYQHTLAILSMPYTSIDKIANETSHGSSLEYMKTSL